MNLARETKPGMGHPFLSAWDYRDKDRKCVLQQGVTDEDLKSVMVDPVLSM